MHPIFPMDNEGNIKIKPLGYVKSPIKVNQSLIEESLNQNPG